ncbi:MAG: hypothetical protein HeimC3_05620 [Candidatus Heimdallarchaeota archaeon LC_3]|nr:MAG: hypothetical protein HeimC3_05620 [Candidatus Heimdallarchaeota archaeon LC_3]
MIGSLLDIKFGQTSLTIEQMTMIKKKRKVNVFFDKINF